MSHKYDNDESPSLTALFGRDSGGWAAMVLLCVHNPYAHPKNCGAVRDNIVEGARKYFGWMLLNGAKIETLKLDPYWKYMEDEDEQAVQKLRRDSPD